MGHLEGNFTPVLYMGRKVPKGYVSKQASKQVSCNLEDQHELKQRGAYTGITSSQ